MWRADFRTAWRVLLRGRLVSLINVGGLSAAMAVCVLALLYVRHEWTYDGFHEKADRIHVVYTVSAGQGPGPRRSTMVAAELLEALRHDYPAIARTVRVQTGYPRVRLGLEWVEAWAVAVDPDLLEMFTFPLAEGRPDRALTDPAGVVLTQETARRHFGDRPALGQPLQVQVRTKDYSVYPPADVTIEEERVVTGVLAPIPPNSSLQFTVMVPAEGASARMFDSVFGAFVELRPGADVAALERQLAAARFGGQDGTGAGGPPPRLLALRDVHFAELLMGPLYDQGQRAYTYTLSGIALLVLVVAAANFANLALGRALGRTGEVGVRKAIGAARGQIARQFLAEAVLVTAASVAVGLALAEALLPRFSGVVGRTLDLQLLSTDTLAGAGLLVLAVALLAGLYPSMLLSRLPPVTALHGSAYPHGRGHVGRGLVVLQFTMSAFLLIVTLQMGRQVDFMKTKHLGFDGDQVVVGGSAGMIDELVLDRFATLLSGHGHVRSVAGAAPAPGLGELSGRLVVGGQTVANGGFYVSPGFVETLGLRLVAGRDFDPHSATDRETAVLLNQTAARRLGDDALGSQVAGPGYGGPGPMLTVIGIVEDFHYDTMRRRIGPIYIRLQQPSTLFGQTGLYYWHLVARLDRADPAAGLRELRQVWPEATLQSDEPTLRFLDESLASRYRSEERWAEVIGLASGFAIVIACMGLFGLAAQAVARRTKEIGIRKALGATVPGILRLLSGEFALLVAAANAVAWPAAYLVTDRWLEDFAYRVDPGIGAFLLAGTTVLLTALATVNLQAWPAARANPVVALRHE